MTIAAKKEKIKNYVDDADGKRIKALYSLLESDIDQSASFELSGEQLDLLDEEDLLHKSGKTKSYSWEEAKEIIRGKATM